MPADIIAEFAILCPACGKGTISHHSPHCSTCKYTARIENRILVTGQVADDHDYPAEGAEVLARVQAAHFWFAARNQLIRQVLLQHFPSGIPQKRVAEIGCGSGYVMSYLERNGWSCIGMDMHLGGLQLARQITTGPLLCASLHATRFAQPVDVICFFDVIEHLADDVAALRAAAAQLKQGGLIVVTVPAGKHLWSEFDQLAGHKRRYDRQSLTSAFQQAGLELVQASYAFSFAVLPILLQRNKKSKQAERTLDDFMKVPPRPLNTLLAFCSTIERRLIQFGLTIPFGTSLIAVGRTASQE